MRHSMDTNGRGIEYGARQLIRHRHTKDPPPAGVGERLAALLRKDKEQIVKNVENVKTKKPTGQLGLAIAHVH